MRKVLDSISQVCHYWANKVQTEGRAGNVYFRDDKIFSYGVHFCMARHLPGGAVAVTTRGYSSSTASHLSEMRAAARHLQFVYCNDPSDSADTNMRSARESIRSALRDAEKPRSRQTTRDGHRARALRIAESANAYLSALPADERGNAAPIGVDTLADVRDALDAFDAAQLKLAAEQREARRVDLLESLAKWRTGEVIVRTGLYELPAALRIGRVGGDYIPGEPVTDVRQVIQTSHGAEIPVNHARRLWPVILQCKASGSEWSSPPEKTFHLGPYALSTIRADGSIVVGCHDIAFTEIERMATALGLSQEVTA